MPRCCARSARNSATDSHSRKRPMTKAAATARANETRASMSEKGRRSVERSTGCGAEARAKALVRRAHQHQMRKARAGSTDWRRLRGLSAVDAPGRRAPSHEEGGDQGVRAVQPLSVRGAAGGRGRLVQAAPLRRRRGGAGLRRPLSACRRPHGRGVPPGRGRAGVRRDRPPGFAGRRSATPGRRPPRCGFRSARRSA